MSGILARGTCTIYDTTDDMTLDQARAAAAALLEPKLEDLQKRVESVAKTVMTPEQIQSTVTRSGEFRTLQTRVTQTAEGLEFVKTEADTIGKRTAVIEGSVRIEDAKITLGKSNSSYQTVVSNDGFAVLERGWESIVARENKVVAPRFSVTDALLLGQVAIRPMDDGHVYFLGR